jgi:peptide/nickel transport system ATP-binding protein
MHFERRPTCGRVCFETIFTGNHQTPLRRDVSAGTLLEIDNLSVEFATERGALHAVCGVSLSVGASRALGIVGESGSGKTVLSRAVLQLLPHNARMSGAVRFDGRELFRLSREALRQLRGREIAVVFQDPMTSLNPVLTVGGQITEALREHLGLGPHEAAARAVTLLTQLGIPDPDRRARHYPHQMSGGMRQRVAIAIALSCAPRLLIADEPTTALDVTVQAQILELLAHERRARNMAMMLITHDLAVVAGRTDEVAVMYAGRIVERAPTRTLFKHMRSPYTQALMAAIPKLDVPPHTRLAAIAGTPPDPMRLGPGCPFEPRCRYARERCRREAPELAGAVEGHQYACWFPRDVQVPASA